jgi:very-short-patch-repair endonuclease
MDRCAEYLIFWRGRDQNALLVEVDKDGSHASSRREDERGKERLFKTHGFHYLRFPAQRVQENPVAVAREITKLRTTRHGK